MNNTDDGSYCCALIKSGEKKGEKCYRPSKCYVRGKYYCGLHAKKFDEKSPEHKKGRKVSKTLKKKVNKESSNI